MGRYPSLNQRLCTVALLCLTVAMLLSACGNEAEPTTAASSDITSSSTTTTTQPPPTSTVSPTTTQSPPTTTVPPTTAPEASEGIGEFDIDRDTVWQDVFDTVTASEQSCIRDAVGTELDSVLRRAILDEDEIGQGELSVLSCLPPQLVEAVFLAGMIFGMEDDGMEVSEDQEACLQEVLAETDVGALLSVIASEVAPSDDAAQMEGTAQLFEMMAGFLRCIPDLLDFDVEEVGDAVGMEEVRPVEVSPAYGSCPVDDFLDQAEGVAEVELGGVVEGVLEHGGDVDVFVFGAVGGELYEIEAGLGTLSDSVVAVCDADGVELGYNDDRAGSLAARLMWRAPATGEYYVEVSGYGEGSYTLVVGVSEVVDDYSDQLEGAFGVGVGDVVGGVLDYEGDVDVFVFGAVEGELYQIDVALGTLSDSVVAVHDADGWELGYNDDREGSWASLLVWRAPATGEYYVEVSGYSEGSYTLAVEVSDVVDDFADGVEGAFGVELGGVVEGVLDYEGDVDVFVFGAVGGELYEIEVGLGTLVDSVVAVLDAESVELGYNDDWRGSLASRLVWRAPATGEYYVEVSGHGENASTGYGEGSYTLEVTVSE